MSRIIAAIAACLALSAVPTDSGPIWAWVAFEVVMWGIVAIALEVDGRKRSKSSVEYEVPVIHAEPRTDAPLKVMRERSPRHRRRLEVRRGKSVRC